MHRTRRGVAAPLTRRDVVVRAAATVAVAALPGAAAAASEKRSLILSGSRELADAGAQTGDWYWEFQTRSVLQMTERGWEFLLTIDPGPD
ncbi:hypothetical protein [Bradyrhizobium sp. RDI18]|uniref:hypothetical protein n=1 Tax=Bradyrhizobium sp. RDI18 TaxID=3367400 RepID=UPI00371FCE2B